MPMRDADEWAKHLCSEVAHEFVVGPWYDVEGLNRERLASLIREAQEDGARAERERVEKVEAARDAAIARAEKAEADAERLHGSLRMILATVKARDKGLRRIEDYYFLGACKEYAMDALGGVDVRADFTMGVPVNEALDEWPPHKERADRAESELHRRKW